MAFDLLALRHHTLLRPHPSMKRTQGKTKHGVRVLNHPPKYEAFEYGGMSLIPWQEIWLSVSAARFRGHGEMIQMFYNRLFEEAVFDDRGAWSLDLRRRN